MNAPTTTSASLVTSPARGGIAVIVLTGPDAGRVMREIFRPRSPVAGEGHLSLGRIVRGDEVLDEAIVSAPVDDIVEINIHGGPHVARTVLSLLAERGAQIVADCRIDPALAAVRKREMHNPAVAGEVLSALRLVSTPLAASAVSAQWSGGLSALANSPQVEAASLRAAADSLGLMKRLLAPAEVVIAGPPNVGKSALANALLGRNVSIVSAGPGTTRDWVRTLTDADGMPFWLTDTAGLWEDAEGIDAEAVRRAWKCVESADLLICVTARNDAEYADLIDRLRATPNVLNVAGKCDLIPPEDRSDYIDGTLPVSARTLDGIEALRLAIRRKSGFDKFDPTSAMAFTDRQADLLAAAAELLDQGDTNGAKSKLKNLLGCGCPQ